MLIRQGTAHGGGIFLTTEKNCQLHLHAISLDDQQRFLALFGIIAKFFVGAACSTCPPPKGQGTCLFPGHSCLICLVFNLRPNARCSSIAAAPKALCIPPAAAFRVLVCPPPRLVEVQGMELHLTGPCMACRGHTKEKRLLCACPQAIHMVNRQG